MERAREEVGRVHARRAVCSLAGRCGVVCVVQGRARAWHARSRPHPWTDPVLAAACRLDGGARLAPLRNANLRLRNMALFSGPPTAARTWTSNCCSRACAFDIRPSHPLSPKHTPPPKITEYPQSHHPLTQHNSANEYRLRLLLCSYHILPISTVSSRTPHHLQPRST